MKLKTMMMVAALEVTAGLALAITCLATCGGGIRRHISKYAK
jgi:hypothetical protein